MVGLVEAPSAYQLKLAAVEPVPQCNVEHSQAGAAGAFSTPFTPPFPLCSPTVIPFCVSPLDPIGTVNPSAEGINPFVCDTHYELPSGELAGYSIPVPKVTELTYDMEDFNSTVVTDRFCETFVELEEDLLWSETSPLGQSVNVHSSCLSGTCDCRYFIGSVKSQLKPCRFASFFIDKDNGIQDKYLKLLWLLTDGCPIVDSPVESYECSNYSSITCNENKKKMDLKIEMNLVRV